LHRAQRRDVAVVGLAFTNPQIAMLAIAVP
jgi:hypothetical protein